MIQEELAISLLHCLLQCQYCLKPQRQALLCRPIQIETSQENLVLFRCQTLRRKFGIDFCNGG